jgi:hypothetical protein
LKIEICILGFIDLLGQDSLDAINTGDPIKVHEVGTVEVGGGE